jgi:hypothetical protein
MAFISGIITLYVANIIMHKKFTRSEPQWMQNKDKQRISVAQDVLLSQDGM